MNSFCKHFRTYGLFDVTRIYNKENIRQTYDALLSVKQTKVTW